MKLAQVIGAALCISLMACQGFKPSDTNSDNGEGDKKKFEDLKPDHQNRVPTTGSNKPDWKPLNKQESDFDAIHYKLAVNLPPECLEKPQFLGDLELTFQPLHDNYQTLTLESDGLQIQSVTLLNNNSTLSYVEAGKALRIDLGQAFSRADALTVKILYKWQAEPNAGMYFRSRSTVKEIETIFTQSEPDYSKYWFPSNSYPNDRATFEASIEVPRPFIAVSNGALIDVKKNSASRIYHWSESVPVATYLYVITAGKWSVSRTSWRNTPVEYYGPSDDIARVAYSLRETPQMMEFFSKKIGLDYPYEKYAQTIVPQYQWGGMEHVTATTLTDRTVHSKEEDDQFSSRGLVSHELAHQWFGDLLTCRSWDHIWLNEGFATYFEMLFQESVKGRTFLYSELEGEAEWYFATDDDDARPVVFPYFRSSLDDYFDGRAYAKGGYILHMLRTQLGDETFDKAIRLYVHSNQRKLVVTDDLRAAFEKASGKNLKTFFDQWVFRPGYPKFKVTYNYSADAKEVEVTVAQTQDTTLPGGIAGTTPIFQGPIALEVDGVRQNIELKGEATEKFRLASDKAPAYVKFNSENAWLAKVETVQDATAWTAQLTRSIDPTARVEAAGALKTLFEGENADLAPLQDAGLAIEACASTEKETWVQSACISTLNAVLVTLKTTKNRTEEVLKWQARASAVAVALVKGAKWEAREAAARGLGSLEEQTAVPLLKNLISQDEKIRVITASVSTLGMFPSKANQEFLIAQLGRKSFRDSLMQAVLNVLPSFKDPSAFAVGETYFVAPYSSNVRSGAMSLMAQLGKQFKDELSERARQNIEKNLVDTDFVIRLSAIGNLERLGNKNAIPALKKVAESDSEGRVRSEAARVAQALEALP